MSNTNVEILVAGAAAAFTVDLLVYPLDTLKTRWQSQDYLQTFAQSAGAKKPPPAAFRGLYQGVGSVVIATLPAAGIFFTTYEGAKRFYSGLLSSSPLPVAAGHALASGTAELASCLVLTPAEVIKQNAQMIQREPSRAASRGGTSMQALRMVWQGQGGPMRRLQAGYSALVARNLPFTALQFPIFESVRSNIWAYRDRTGRAAGRTTRDAGGGVGGGGDRRIEGNAASGLLETGLVTGASAALSGSLAAVVTTPTDVVKTRMMLSAGGPGESGGELAPGRGDERNEHRQQQKRQNGLRVARQVYRERGVRGLFRGGLLRAGWTALASGLYLGTYEAAKVWLKGGEA